MSRLLMVLAMVTASVACAAASEPRDTAMLTPASAPAVSCDIEATRISGGVRLEAFAHLADASFDLMDYEFVITKHGAGGSSDIMQGGELTNEAEQSLGAVDLSLERGARYRAELTLRDSEGEVCATEIRS